MEVVTNPTSFTMIDSSLFQKFKSLSRHKHICMITIKQWLL